MWVINMSEIKTGRGYVYSIQYHIVWCVKYRYKILTSKIEKSLIKILIASWFINGCLSSFLVSFFIDSILLEISFLKLFFNCSSLSLNGLYFSIIGLAIEDSLFFKYSYSTCEGIHNLPLNFVKIWEYISFLLKLLYFLIYALFLMHKH